MRFEPIDRSLRWEFGYWVDTLRRWYDEGLPRRHGIPDSLGGSAPVNGVPLGFDQFIQRLPVDNCFVHPAISWDDFRYYRARVAELTP